MNLIFDRTQADVTYAAELNRKLGRGEALTSQELADWDAGLKGSYNANDMNRVDAAVRELGGLLTAAGYPVEYVDPKQPEPEPEDEDIILTSADFQAGAYLYTTGEFRAGYTGYICTKARISVQSGKCICVRTNLTLLQYSGFVWYDADGTFIANTFPTTSQGEAPIQWDGNFQAIPPANAVYCDININSSNITPATVGTVYVRQELSPETASLPDGYQRVEYIESSGNEYIDTGFKPDSNTRVICEFMPLDSTKAYGIFGSRTAYLSSAYNLFAYGMGIYFQDDYNNTGTTNIETVANALYVIDKNKNISTMNGTRYSVAYSSFEAEYSMYLFGVNTSGAVNSAQLGALRMYSCTIYDNDILVRYYIPCTSSTGAVGLYDTVSGSFFGNANASTVKPVELPDGYTQIEYIQTSSSGGQYIDTKFIPNNNTRTVCTISKFPLTKHSQSAFGVRVSSSSRAYDILVSENPNDYRTDFGSQQVHFPTSLNVSGHMVIDKNKNVTIINNTNTVTASSSTFSCSGSMYMMAINNNGSASLFCESVLLYGAQIYDNGSLVRSFTPCKDSTGAIGLYDTIGGRFYRNSGSGSFTAGNTVTGGFTHGKTVPEPSAKSEWTVGDIITQPVWAQYIANMQHLRDAYYTMPDTPKLPEPTAPLTFDGANAIEKLLYDISRLYDAMVASYRPCGAFKCGNNARHLPLQRSVI